MTFLKRLFGSSTESGSEGTAGADDNSEALPDDRPRVTAWIRLADPNFGNDREQQRIFELENRIIGAVELAGAGTYDTNELVNGAFGMRLVGPDTERLLGVLRPLLVDAPAGSYVTVRAAGATSEERVEIDAADTVA